MQYRSSRLLALPLTCIAALLSACGGSSTDATATATTMAAPLATASTILQLDDGSLPAADAQQYAQPQFHMAPVLLDAPADATATSADAAVHTRRAVAIPPPEHAPPDHRCAAHGAGQPQRRR
jgi:hypothetical protein